MKRILSGLHNENMRGNVCGDKKRKYRILPCVLVMIMCCCSCTDGGAAARTPVQSTDTAMGTIIRQTIYVDGQEEITDDILKIISDLERDVLSWRLDTSEVYRANASAGQEAGIVLSEELSEILTDCMEVSAACDGAFDVTIGNTVRLWNIDAWTAAGNASDYMLPGEEELSDSMEHSGYEKLKLRENSLSLPAMMQLDFGAVGKGVALDRVKEALDGQERVKGAVISVGGSILTYGQKPDGTPWRVGVINPHDTSQNVGYLTLDGQWCVSTSGDYERFVEADGVRYHHIIDPATGYPADSGLSSVTILAGNGLLSDALSTACFILGAEKGGDLAGQFGAEALFVDKDGNITMTEGMEKYYN